MKLSEIRKSRFNIRKSYMHETVEDLAASISQHGLLSKLVLRKAEEGWENLAGGRRWEALVHLHGGDYELPRTDYIEITGSDHEALVFGLTEQVHRISFSSMELADAAYLLKETNKSISKKDIAKTLWTTEARVRRVLALKEDSALIPESVKEELNNIDDEGKSFTDAHWDRLKDVVDISDKNKVEEVCQYIIEHDIPPSRVADVVKQMDKKAAKEAGVEPAEREASEGTKSKDPNVISEDVYAGYLEYSGGTLAVNGKKELTPIDVSQIVNYLTHPDFKVSVKGKLTVKALNPDRFG